MAETRLGHQVHQDRGYMVMEVLEAGPQGTVVTGFMLVGPLASNSIIYAQVDQAIEAIDDIEARMSAVAPPHFQQAETGNL